MSVKLSFLLWAVSGSGCVVFPGADLLLPPLLMNPPLHIKFMKSLPLQPARWDEEQAGAS